MGMRKRLVGAIAGILLLTGVGCVPQPTPNQPAWAQPLEVEGGPHLYKVNDNHTAVMSPPSRACST